MLGKSLLAFGIVGLVAHVASGCGTDEVASSPDAPDAGSPERDAAPPPPVEKFSVGGTVTGLLGTGLVLQDNGGDDLGVAADGTFVFTTKIAKGASYEISVKTPPSGPSQTCTVTGGSGVVASGDVSTVTVNCATNSFAVGGTVTGLAGAGLVVQNNGGEDLAITANGTFAFPKTLTDLGPYAVTVLTQPTNAWQSCIVTNGAGNVAGAAVTNVAITCTSNPHKVKGTVTGLDGTGLVLQNNGGDDLSITADGPFEFATSVPSGIAYLVSVLTNPSGKSQTCTVASGTGTIADADVTDVAVTCVTNQYTVGGNVSGLTGSIVLTNNGGDDLTANADGPFTFSTSITSGGSYSVAVKKQPEKRFCSVASGSGTVTSANVTDVAVTCSDAHHDGFGHTWNDGTTPETWTAAEGVEACKAWSRENGVDPNACTPSGCGCSSDGSCAYNPQTGGNPPRYVWFYSGTLAGQVTANCCGCKATTTWR